MMKMFSSLIFTWLITITACNDLSLFKIDQNLPEIVWKVSTRRALCYPTEEVMGVIANEAHNHNWGYSTKAFDYQDSLQRVGQVLCRQLGYSFFESMEPVSVPMNSSQPLLWTASCLGYEPLVSHCFYQEMEDFLQSCRNLVGIKCGHCFKNVALHRNDEPYTISSPGFPDTYPDSAICRWNFKMENNKGFNYFSVTLKHFSLPKRNVEENCAAGYMEISGNSNNSKYCKPRVLCGSLPSKEFRFNCSSLSIRWIAGIFHPRSYSTNSSGFQLVVQTVFAENSSKIEDLSISSNIDFHVSLTIGATTGIVIGVILTVALCIAALLGCRFALRKREEIRNRNSMAERIDSRRNNFSGCVSCRNNLGAPPRPQFFSKGNNFEFKVTSPVGGLPRNSVSSAYEEWNPDFENGSINMVPSYLILEEANRRMTMSPKQFLAQEGNCNKANPDSSDFKFPIPVIKVTKVKDRRLSRPDGETYSDASTLSNFSGSSGSNSVFYEEEGKAPMPCHYENERKSTFVIYRDPLSEISASESTIEPGKSIGNDQVCKLALETPKIRRGSANDVISTPKIINKTLSKSFSTVHISNISESI